MSDRLPGSSWDNPIWYRGYRIYPGEPEISHKCAVAFCHDSYDGAEDANDHRAGYAASVSEAKAEIDELEAEIAAQRSNVVALLDFYAELEAAGKGGIR